MPKRLLRVPWFVYILQCADGTLYTGITTDVDARLARHQAGKGARYTRGRAPLRCVYRESVCGKSAALVREYEIKGLSRKAKLTLISGNKKTRRRERLA
jgi:predicted GIY-YIG superfamily endonuclease